MLELRYEWAIRILKVSILDICCLTHLAHELNMISQIATIRFGRLGFFVEGSLGSTISRHFSSQPDDKDSPAGVSTAAKTVSRTNEVDDEVLKAVTNASKKSTRVGKRGSFQRSDDRTWIEESIQSRRSRNTKGNAEDNHESLTQFSEAVKALRRPPPSSPLDIIDDKFFLNRRQQAKATKERSMQASWKLKPEEYGSRVQEAAKRVTAKAGEATAVLEEELMKGLDQLDLKTRLRKSVKPKVSSGPDMDLLQNINFEDIVQPKAQTSSVTAQKHSRHTFEEQHDQLDKVGADEVLAEFFSSGKSSKNLKRRPHSTERSKMYGSLNELLSEPPLNIFSSNLEKESGWSLSLWPTLLSKELHRNTCFQPSNWWAQCIQWTEEGKMWHFPINNEQGMAEEENVDFTEHIFLDHHIESWCPKQGPIKHFMDLVLIGLSKNPYLSVQEKVENIEWFRAYFEKHKTLLQEIDVLDSPRNPPLAKPSALE